MLAVLILNYINQHYTAWLFFFFFSLLWFDLPWFGQRVEPQLSWVTWKYNCCFTPWLPLKCLQIKIVCSNILQMSAKKIWLHRTNPVVRFNGKLVTNYFTTVAYPGNICTSWGCLWNTDYVYVQWIDDCLGLVIALAVPEHMKNNKPHNKCSTESSFIVADD